MKYYGSLFILFTVLNTALFSTRLWASDQGQTTFSTPQETLYSIQKISVLTGYDNMNRIYAEPLTEALAEKLQTTQRFEFLQGSRIQPFPVEEFKQNQGSLSSFFKSSQADAAFHLSLKNQGNGLTVTVSLFTANDLRPLSLESSRAFEKFDTESLRDEVFRLAEQVLRKLPYDGYVLARTGETITLSIGRNAGVQVGQTLSIVNMLKLNRHPTLDFVVSSEHQVLGTVRVTKVDQELSFADILTEVRPQSIERLSKVTGLHPSQYFEWSSGPRENPAHSMYNQASHPGWSGLDMPTFGLIGGSVGLGRFEELSNISGIPSLDTGKNIYPRVQINGEAWINPRWIAKLRVIQGLGTVNNPRSGSNPKNLGLTVSRYDLSFGYRHSFMNDFFGPFLEFYVGYAQSQFRFDRSTPWSFTSLKYSNMFVNFAGEFPLTPSSPWSMGARVYMHLSPALSEKYVTSGNDSNNSIHEFSLILRYRIQPNVRISGNLDFTSFNSDFSGVGSRGEQVNSMDIRDNSLNVGLDYLF